MITLSATVGSAELGALKVLTTTERAANRDAFGACVRVGIETGELRPDTDAAGLVALFEGLLIGFSIQAVDQVPARALDGAITERWLPGIAPVVSTIRPVKRVRDVLPSHQRLVEIADRPTLAAIVPPTELTLP